MEVARDKKYGAHHSGIATLYACGKLPVILFLGSEPCSSASENR